MQGSEKMTDDTVLQAAWKLICTNDTVRINGTYSIASYEENMVIIKCADKSICISGENILITLFCSDEIHISGTILSISFA